jgi:intein/homing endonuclease/superfamily II DNA or RNA helicase
MDEAQQTALEKLRVIREREDLSIKPSRHLRTSFVGADGSERSLKVRNYQVQMILHLMAMPRFIVGDDTGLGKCVTGDTLIVTDQGVRRIDEMHPWAPMNPDTFQPPSQPVSVLVNGEARPVKNFYRGGVKPTVTAVTRYGFQNTGSYVHPIMVRRDGVDQWVNMADLRVGDAVCIDRTASPFPDTDPDLPVPDTSRMGGNVRVFDVPSKMNPDLARLLGYTVAEGWTNHHSMFVISQDKHQNTEVWSDIRDLIRGQLSYEAREPDYLSLLVTSVYLREYLRIIGVPDALSAGKTVPWSIMRGTRESVRQFLRGYFEGDGSVSDGIEVSSASAELLRQVQVLLLRFGIVSRRAPKMIKGRTHTYWRLTIFGDDARKFRDAVGFVSPRKVAALDATLDRGSNPNHDVVPDARAMVEDLRAEVYAKAGLHGYKGAGIAKRWGVSFFNTLSHVRSGRRNPTYGFLRRLLAVSDEVGSQSTPSHSQVQVAVDRWYYYDPVVSITHGEAEVFDIEVDHPDHSFVGNGFVNHNTLSSIAACCYLFDREPDTTVVVLTKKSVVNQWADEIRRFTMGVEAFTAKGTPAQRRKAYAEFKAHTGPKVIIMGYRTAVQDFTELQDWSIGVMILDEATVVKNPTSQIHQVVRHLASPDTTKRCWGLTATLIKNNLVEGYGIYRVVVPSLFGMTATAFQNDYCIVQMQPIGKGRKVPVVVGYRKSDVDRFRLKIEPYYLGRPKHAVATELPALTSKIVKVGMTAVQHFKYQEALAGILQVGAEEKEVTKLTAVTYCQEIVNHPGLIQCDGDSEKLDELVDMLSSGDLEGEKVIVYTRFARMVTIGMKALEDVKIKCVRVTGAESEDERAAAQRAFQDPNSDVKVIWITSAGNDAINLQAAKALVFYDTPFSAGDFLQTLGRMIRIGSIHTRVTAIHLVADNTVDERVMTIMEKKMGLLEAVLGKRIKGEGEDDGDTVIRADREIDDLFEALRKDAQGMIRG